jgi:hypothetical protein
MSQFYMFTTWCGSNIQLTELRIQLKVHKDNIDFIYLFKYGVLSFEKFNGVKKNLIMSYYSLKKYRQKKNS